MPLTLFCPSPPLALSCPCVLLRPAVWRCFDLATLYGFWSGPADCFGRYFEYKGKQGVHLMAEVLRKAASLDTYKPKKGNKGGKRSKSFSSFSSFHSLSSKSSSGSEVGTPARSKSAPADIRARAGEGEAPQQQQKGGKKAQKKAAAVAVAAGVGMGAGAIALAQRAPSEASSLIATASNPPGAPSLSISDGCPVREMQSDAASHVSASSAHSPMHSSERNTQSSPSSPGSMQLSSSDSDTA